MPIIDRDITIAARTEDLFNFTSTPVNLPQIWPSLLELKEQRCTPEGGYRYRWTYQMAGRIFSGEGECTDIVTNHWFTAKNTGPIESKITWTFRQKDKKTRVTFTNDYTLPVSLLNFLPEARVNALNEAETELILRNLKARFEGK
jgi:hypothetical protein